MALYNYLHSSTYVQDNNLCIHLYSENRINCITDRTQEDVDRAKYLTNALLTRTNTEEELLEFQKVNLRGALNYSDLARIEFNLALVADLLNVTFDRFPHYSGIPRVSYFKVLLEDVQKIRDAGYRYSDTPQVPEMPLNTYQKINDIERILLHAYSAYFRNTGADARSFCGEMYANNNSLI